MFSLPRLLFFYNIRYFSFFFLSYPIFPSLSNPFPVNLTSPIITDINKCTLYKTMYNFSYRTLAYPHTRPNLPHPPYTLSFTLLLTLIRHGRHHARAHTRLHMSKYKMIVDFFNYFFFLSLHFVRNSLLPFSLSHSFIHSLSHSSLRGEHIAPPFTTLNDRTLRKEG